MKLTVLGSHGTWPRAGGAAHAVAYIGHNRLRVNADGSVSWFERNLTRVPTAPVDPTHTAIGCSYENTNGPLGFSTRCTWARIA